MSMISCHFHMHVVDNADFTKAIWAGAYATGTGSSRRYWWDGTGEEVIWFNWCELPHPQPNAETWPNQCLAANPSCDFVKWNDIYCTGLAMPLCEILPSH